MKDKYEGIEEMYPYMDPVQNGLIENLVQSMPGEAGDLDLLSGTYFTVSVGAQE